MQIEQDAREEELRLVLRGELDILTAPLLAQALQEPLSAAIPVRLDLSELRFLDSLGLRAILTAHEAAQRRGTPLAVVTGEGQAARLLAIAGVADLLNRRNGTPAA
jgi:anti-sigma B factor antagonist